jgi:hypothetical protein
MTSINKQNPGSILASSAAAAAPTKYDGKTDDAGAFAKDSKREPKTSPILSLQRETDADGSSYLY